jgi:hypothetical protein
MKAYPAIPALLVASLALGAGQSGGPYEIGCDSVGAGGGQQSGGAYAQDSEIGGTGGAGQGGGYESRQGYAGQLYDLVDVLVSSLPSNVNEGATCQLTATGLYDDDSVGVLGGMPAWSVLSGPLASVDTGGVATADVVYEDTAASARAVYEGRTGTVAVTVVNVDHDNYGLYAGDVIWDEWQVLHFGVGNSNALAGRDPDEDEQNNLFEWVANVLPTSGVSRFALGIESGNDSNEMVVVFDPVFGDRTYQVEQRDSLTAGDWAGLVGGVVSDAGAVRRVTDTNAVLQRFYRVRIGYTP